jgi:hypothetical protein
VPWSYATGAAPPPFTQSFTNVIKTSERSTDMIDEHARGEKVELGVVAQAAQSA